MPFPTNFSASAQIWLHGGEQLTNSAILDYIERVFQDLGAKIVARDQDAFEFRVSPISLRRSLQHVGSGWISIAREEHCITINADVRTSPYTLGLLSILGISTGVFTASGGAVEQVAWIAFLWLWFSTGSYVFARRQFASFLARLERPFLPPSPPGRLTSA